MIRRVLILWAIALGLWAQSASACEEGNPALQHAQKAIEFSGHPAISDFAVFDPEHRCECPAVAQDAQATISEFDKDSFLSYVKRAVGLSSRPGAAFNVLAEHSRASSFIALRSEPPPYLLIPRLRQ